MNPTVLDLFQEGLRQLPAGPARELLTAEAFFGAAHRLIQHFGSRESYEAQGLTRQLQFLLHECEEPPERRARLAVTWAWQMTLKDSPREVARMEKILVAA